MTILVTGAAGTVGSYFARLAPTFDAPLDLCGRERLDVLDRAALTERFAARRYSAVVHLVAATDVDRCEREPDWAAALNVRAAENVARVAAAHDAHLIHVSTTAVFGGDGADGPFSEDDRPAAPNVYARTKRDGEIRVQNAGGRFTIARTAWVMGGGPADKKFIGKVKARLDAGDPIKAVDDQFGSPTYAHDLVVCIRALLARSLLGMVHVTNGGRASRYDMALHMKSVLGSASPIEPVPASTFPLPAPRATSDASLSLVLPRHGLGDIMPSWQDALQRYLAEWGPSVPRPTT